MIKVRTGTRTRRNEIERDEEIDNRDKSPSNNRDKKKKKREISDRVEKITEPESGSAGLCNRDVPMSAA